MSYTGLKNVNRKNEEHLIPDHIYYDLDITNNNLGLNNSISPLINFNEIRTSTFLQNPSDYYLSIVRFQVETTSLPLFIPQVDITQNNPNVLVYTVTLVFGANQVTIPLLFSPQDLTVPPPSPPFTASTYGNPYYYIYNIQKFIFDTVNPALQTAFTALLALGALPTTNAPFIEFDPFTNYCILNADVLGYNQASASPQIQIFMNANLYQLFNSFTADFFGGTISPNLAVRLKVFNNNNTNIINYPTYNALQMYQEFSVIPVWNPVKSIVFTSNLLPVNPSYAGDPVVIIDNNVVSPNSSNNAYVNVISDYQVELIKGNETRPLVQYVPTAEYRLFDLIGNNPLGTLNLQCFWKDRFNNLVPFQLKTGCTASIKIMFRNKKYADQGEK